MTGTDSDGSVRGTVTDVSYYGHDAMVTVAVQGHDTPVGIRVAGPLSVRPGEETGVRVVGEFKEAAAWSGRWVSLALDLGLGCRSARWPGCR